MRNQALLALSLLAMVFVSGCIGQPPTPTGKGLAIKSFAPDFSEVRSGERVTFSSLVENVGEADATGVKAQLFGLNFVGEWKIKDTNTDPIRSIGTGSSILRKADTALGIAGENYEFTWNVQSPENLRVDNTYTANLRVYYKYNTYSTSILHFVSYDYLRSLTSEQFNKEKSAAGVTSSVYSKAPVSVKLSGGSRPFVVYAESGSSDTFSVQIEINNIDTGNAFSKDVPYLSIASGDLHKVYVTVKTSDLDLDCSNTLDSKSAGWVTLTKGTTKTLFCTATVFRDKIGNSIDYTVNVDLDYGYYVDSTTKITVLKKEGIITTTCTSDNQCQATDTDGGDKPLIKGTCTNKVCTNSVCVNDYSTSDGCSGALLYEYFPHATYKNICDVKAYNCNSYCISIDHASGTCSSGVCSCTPTTTTTTTTLAYVCQAQTCSGTDTSLCPPAPPGYTEVCNNGVCCYH